MYLQEDYSNEKVGWGQSAGVEWKKEDYSQNLLLK